MSWVALCGSDSPPFIGDPGALYGTANSLTTIGSDLKAQATLLQGYIDNAGGWTGEAKDACVRTISNLPHQLASAGLKYENAAGALRPYASALQTALAKAESLRGQAEQAQTDVRHFSGALHDQRNWEHAEATRARSAQSDPTQGSPVAAPWPGHNNQVALHNAQSALDGLRSELARARQDLQSAAVAARIGIDAAADIVHDDRGLVGLFTNGAADIRRGAKAFADFCAANGLDLAALSETLGTLSSWLGMLALLPIPGAQIFGLVGTAVGIVGMAASLVLVVAGEKSFRSWAVENGPGLLLPAAAKGLRGIALAKRASSAGEVSQVAKNLLARGAKDGHLIPSASRLIENADHFEMGVMKNTALKLFNPSTTRLGGAKLDAFGAKLLTGQAAQNSAVKVIKMSLSGTTGKIGGGVAILDKANKFKENYDAVVAAKSGLLSFVGFSSAKSGGSR